MYNGALYLLAFGLGTLPALLGFGMLASLMSSKLTHRIVRLSGVVVIVLGLIMLQRGLVLTGTGYDLVTILLSVTAKSSEINETKTSANETETTSISGGSPQVIYMNVTRNGWQPNKFVLKKGVPVRWVIDGKQISNCNRAIQVPKLGLSFDVKPGIQVIEFTPYEEGVITWSCWMGMLQGTFIVKEEV